MAVESDRRLAAIMFTDIVGFTRSTQANEALTLELLEEHRKLVRPFFPPRGGTEVKTIGDAFLVEFRSALEAVLCAVDIQRKMADRNSSVQEPRKIQLRVGIHVGDVVHGAGDVYGDAVNIASRIEPLAEPGGICISQQVYDNIRNKTELVFKAMGPVRLKNLEFPLGVYKVVLPGSESGMSKVQAPRERLAVLPFVNISPDPNDEFFADGLTEELITKLSGVGGLKVIARTSVMNYKKKDMKVSEIGNELNVGSIVEGSVRKSGNKIRVTVQLIDARTEEHLWASNYDKDLDDVFAIQSDIASRVASSVSSGAFFKVHGTDTKSVEAYTLYIKAMQNYHEASEGSLRQAKAMFEEAIALDPDFARAYAGLSQTWARLGVNGYEEYSVVSTKAEPAARKALDLDPDSAEGHAALAEVCWILDRFDECVTEAETAIGINPNLAEAYIALGIVQSTIGKLDEAIASGRKAYELDPLNENLAFYLAMLLNKSGHPQEALPIMERTRALHPGNPRTYSRIAESYMMQRNFEKAQEWLDKGLALNPREPILRLNQGILYALTGRRKEAEAAQAEIETNNVEAVRIFGALFINAALGNVGLAFKALYRAAEIHAWPGMIKTLPIFAELRKDPRWPEFCRKVGIPP